MIAQLSHIEPRGSPPSSNIGVSCAGSLVTKAGSLFLPQTSTSSKSSPAARTKIRAARLFTLGVRMFSVLAAMGPSRLSLDELRLVLAATQAAERHQLDLGLHDEDVAQCLANRHREGDIWRRALSQLDEDRQRR